MHKLVQSASRIYFDTNAIIYYVERNDDCAEKIREVIYYAIKTYIPIFVSEVGVAECLYGAYKLKSDALVEKYNDIFYDIGLFSLIPIDGDHAIAAAKTGADYGLKLIDAIHFFAAI